MCTGSPRASSRAPYGTYTSKAKSNYDVLQYGHRSGLISQNICRWADLCPFETTCDNLWQHGTCRLHAWNGSIMCWLKATQRYSQVVIFWDRTIFSKMKIFLPIVFSFLTAKDAFAVIETAQFGGCLNSTLLTEGMWYQQHLWNIYLYTSYF